MQSLSARIVSFNSICMHNLSCIILADSNPQTVSQQVSKYLIGISYSLENISLLSSIFVELIHLWVWHQSVGQLVSKYIIDIFCSLKNMFHPFLFYVCLISLNLWMINLEKSKVEIRHKSSIIHNKKNTFLIHLL